MLRRLWIVLPMLASLAFGQDTTSAGEPLTARIPKTSPVCIRLPSLNRLDALQKKAAPILQELLGKEKAAQVETLPLSGLLLLRSGATSLPVDRDSPIYVGFSGEDPVVYTRAAPGATLDGQQTLKEGLVAVLTDGVLEIAKPGDLTVEVRGAAVQMPAGDVAVHVFVKDLVARYSDKIDAVEAKAKQEAGTGKLPPKVDKFAMALIGLGFSTVREIDSADLGLTWQDEGVLAVGSVEAIPDSSLSKFLAGAGAAGRNNLMAYMPAGSFMEMDHVGSFGWPTNAITGFVAKSMGPEWAKLLPAVMGPSAAIQASLTGRWAYAVTPQMMMSFSTEMLAEAKPDAKLAALLAHYDVKPTNDALAKVGFPLEFIYEPAVETYRGIAINRMRMDASKLAAKMPQIGMFVGMAAASSMSYMAADDHFFYLCQSSTGLQDIKGLIDRVLDKKIAERQPHLEEMARLGATRNFGFSMNLAILKNYSMFFMGEPKLAKALTALPDKLYLSSLTNISSAGISWKTDIPVEQIAAVAAKIKQASHAKKAKKPKNEKWD